MSPSREEMPVNVRLVFDGQEYGCDLIRDPSQDERGETAWWVVPRVPLPPGVVPSAVRADVLPASSLLLVDLDPPGGDR